MPRTKKIVRPAPPTTVFGYLSGPIEKEIKRMANRVCGQFMPRTITAADAVSLCVEEGHIPMLSAAWKMCKDRVRPQTYESMTFALPGVPQYVVCVSISGNNPAMVLPPDYARKGTQVRPIDTAPLDLINLMKSQLGDWWRLSADFGIVLETFRWLDRHVGGYSRQQLRYVFPAIAPLLRRARENAFSYDEAWYAELEEELVTWTGKLADTNAKHNAPVEYDMRQYVQHANRTMAKGIALDLNIPYTPVGFTIIPTDSRFVGDPPGWKGESIIRLGLAPRFGSQ